MPDMLVQLLKAPAPAGVIDSLRAQGVVVRRANPFEAGKIRRFVERHFSEGWADEIEPCYSRQPVSLYIALRDGHLIGFGAYEATRRCFFGPTGVVEAERGKGIGKALLVVCLYGLREMGYAYGIIGGAGPVEFYRKAVGATSIPDSSPGIYADAIRDSSP